MIPAGPDDLVVTKWGARFRGRRFPCSVGWGGIAAEKTEGDGVSPAGVWRLVGGGFRPDRGARPRPPGFLRIKPVGPFDIWSDDPADPNYNHGLSAPGHRFSHEKLFRADPLYNLVLFSDWNWPHAKPGQGSAIFVHAWRKPRHPTAGCIALNPGHLRWILARWTPRSRIIVRAS